MALEDLIVLWESDGNCYNGGVLVPRNAAQLAAKCDLGAGNMDLDLFGDEYVNNPFSVDDIVWLHKEKVKVAGAGAAQGEFWRVPITRAQESTADANHNLGCQVFPKTGGTTVLTHTVTAGEEGTAMHAFRGQGGAPAQWEILINGVFICPPIHTLYHQEFFFPWSGSAVTENDVILIRALNWFPETVCWAQVIA